MITLPEQKTLSRGPLRGFWISTCLPLTAATIVGAGRTVGRRGAAIATAGAVGVTASGILRPGIVRRPYRAWARLSRLIADRLTSYTAFITHGTAITPSPPHGNQAPGSGATAWVPAAAQPADAYTSPSTSSLHGRAHDAPLPVTYRWLTEAGVQRRRQLLICLAVLRWLQPGVTTDHPEALPRDTYTLH